jgi:hypothetical protein
MSVGADSSMQNPHEAAGAATTIRPYRLPPDGIENAARAPRAMDRAFVVGYDTRNYPFAELISDSVFDGVPLSRLDALLPDPGTPHSASELQQISSTLRDRLERMPDEAPFYPVYARFMLDVIAPAFGGRISYSKHPTFRVHLPGAIAISDWHRDADVTRRPEQINIWLPLVDVRGGNSLWVESHYGARDFQPVELRYGECLLFDGGFLLHGSRTNTAGTSRVSLDLRFSISRNEPGLDRGILSLRPPGLRMSKEPVRNARGSAARE